MNFFRACFLWWIFLSAFSALSSSAHAQASLSFSGGFGTPLSITLNQTITYTATASYPHGPYFLFKDVGDIFNGEFQTFAFGSLTFSNPRDPGNFSLSYGLTHLSSGVQTASDLELYGSQRGVNVGDVITLHAGTITTDKNFAGAPPSTGSFTTFLVTADAPYIPISTINGPGAVPEPATWVVLGLGGGLLSIANTRRRAR